MGAGGGTAFAREAAVPCTALRSIPAGPAGIATLPLGPVATGVRIDGLGADAATALTGTRAALALGYFTVGGALHAPNVVIAAKTGISFHMIAPFDAVMNCAASRAARRVHALDRATTARNDACPGQRPRDTAT